MVQRRPRQLVSRPGAALFGLAIALAVLPLVVPILPAGHGLHEGDVAPRTIEANHGAQYESTVLTRAAREAAAQGVEAVYLPPDPAIQAQQAERLGRLLDQVRVIRQRTDLTVQQQLDEVAALSAASSLSSAGRANLLVLDRASYEGLVQRAQRALSDILERGVRQNEALRAIKDYLAQPGALPSLPTEITALNELLSAFVAPNVQVDDAATARNREAASGAVATVIATYFRGQVVVHEGETIEADDIEALKQTGVIDAGFDVYDAGAGAIAALGTGVMLGYFVFAFQPFGPPARRRAVVVAVLVVAALVTIRVVLPPLTPDADGRQFAYAIPVAVAPMLAASFGNLPFAVVVALAVGVVSSFIGATSSDLAGAEYIGPLESLEIAATSAAAGIAGAVFLARAERLSRFAVASAGVGLATAAVLGMFWLVSAPRETETLGWIAAASSAQGLGAGVISAGLFLVLSLGLAIPTRLQLGELAQADHPLLRRLQEEAPGTFHHSLMVGTLAERAAGNVGADPLLARVGAYYHDIGKLARPECFIENMLGDAPNPHLALPPEESAAIIRAHVTDGLEIARKARLPAVVREFIPQHHGDRLVTYFYRHAARADPGADPGRFRYPGPRPATRETAIVMLADSCEAVVRAGDDRSPSRIDELVDGVFAERLSEGQFDDCDITLRELQVVARTFKSTLRAVYHPRVEYPQPGPEELAAIASGRDPAR